MPFILKPELADKKIMRLFQPDGGSPDEGVIFTLGNSSQGVVLTFEMGSAPAGTVTITPSVITKDMPETEFNLVSAVEPITEYIITIDAAVSVAVPIPLPFGTNQLLIRASGLGGAENITVGYIPERSLMSPTGIEGNRAFDAPRGYARN